MTFLNHREVKYPLLAAIIVPHLLRLAEGQRLHEQESFVHPVLFGPSFSSSSSPPLTEELAHL